MLSLVRGKRQKIKPLCASYLSCRTNVLLVSVWLFQGWRAGNQQAAFFPQQYVSRQRSAHRHRFLKDLSSDVGSAGQWSLNLSFSARTIKTSKSVLQIELSVRIQKRWLIGKCKGKICKQWHNEVPNMWLTHVNCWAAQQMASRRTAKHAQLPCASRVCYLLSLQSDWDCCIWISPFSDHKCATMRDSRYLRKSRATAAWLLCSVTLQRLVLRLSSI